MRRENNNSINAAHIYKAWTGQYKHVAMDCMETSELDEVFSSYLVVILGIHPCGLALHD